MATLYMVNVPHDCSDLELVDWVCAAGVGVKSIRLIRDEIAGVSPSFAYVDITETVPLVDAVNKLNGQAIRERVIHVSKARAGRTAA